MSDFEALIEHLANQAQVRGFCVAYSGGVDSHLLLALLAAAREQGRLPQSLTACHINHGIHPDADRWEQHCRQTCAQLSVPLRVRRLVLDTAAGNLEARARAARYEALTAIVGEGDVLLLGHHQDDQVETMLYALMRGSGVRGLSGMPQERALGSARLQRPLLTIPRSRILTAAAQRGLHWIDDPSNDDAYFDRNFLRHQVFPELAQRWPGFRSNWQRSAQLLREADAVLQESALADWLHVSTERGQALDLSRLQVLSPARQRNLLYHWLHDLAELLGEAGPAYSAIERVLTELIPAREDAMPEVPLPLSDGQRGLILRRHAHELHALFAHSPPATIGAKWSPEMAVDFPGPLGRLWLHPVSAGGLSRQRLLAADCQWRLREGGERFKPAGRRTRTLKKYLQDAGVPPWLRDSIPLLFCDDELVAVGDLMVADGWLQDRGDDLVAICWLRSDLHCGY